MSYPYHQYGQQQYPYAHQQPYGAGYPPPSPGLAPSPGPGSGTTWGNLGYAVPALNYQPHANMDPWDLARAMYNGSRLERGVFDTLLAEAGNFTRHLKERAARRAHHRIYVQRGGARRNSQHFGGAAAFQAFILWDRDHHSVFHTYPLAENRSRLVGMALAEVSALFERMQPTAAHIDEAREWAAATAKHLFDLHYDLNATYSRRRERRTREREREREFRHGYAHGYNTHGHAHYDSHRRYYDETTESESLDEGRRRDYYPPVTQVPVMPMSMQPVQVPVQQYPVQYPVQYPPYPYPQQYAAPAVPIQPVQPVPVMQYPGIDPMTGYPYRTDQYGNPLPERSWYYGYAPY